MNLKLKIFLGVFVLLMVGFDLSFTGEQQFSYLAKSFLQGKAYFLEKPGTWGDALLFNGKYYWHLGLLPTMLVLPGVWLFSFWKGFFLQGILNPIFVVGTFGLVYALGRKIGYSKNDAVWWGLAFCFGSAFLGVAMWPWSWYFVQVISVFLIWLVIWYKEIKKNDLVSGLYSGLILLTRVQGLVGVGTYYLIRSLQEKWSVKKLVVWLIPIVVAGLIWGAYNYVRFENWTRLGYELQTNVPEFLIRSKARFGEFSYNHVPRNLYYLLIAGPKLVFDDEEARIIKPPFIRADGWGMGILVTSPYVIYLAKINMKDPRKLALLAGVIIGIMPALFYFGTGYRQFGYRYALDVWPMLFWMLMQGYRENNGRLSKRMKVLFAGSAVLNLYLMLGLLI